jgi:hypothetical protein
MEKEKHIYSFKLPFLCPINGHRSRRKRKREREREKTALTQCAHCIYFIKSKEIKMLIAAATNSCNAVQTIKINCKKAKIK